MGCIELAHNGLPSLSSEHRHEVLEGLSARDRREFIDFARLYNLEA